MGAGRIWGSAAAAAYVAAAVLLSGEPPAVEQDLFRVLNGGPELSLLRVPQQLGTPWGPLVLGSALLVAGRRSAGVKAMLALPVLKAAEVATKKMTSRPRPLYVLPTELRDDAPVEGGSFPSGHTALAVGTSLLAVPHLPRPVAAVLAAGAATSAYVRVHQGAHHPADVLGGALLGAAVGTALADRP